MITLHYEIEQGSSQWLAMREDKFTGSNAYKLLGSRGAIEDAKATNDGFQGNFWTRRGHVLEQEAVELYEAIMGVPVARCGFVENDKYPDCLFSPDGLPPGPLLEVKCFSEVNHMKLIAGKIPLAIQAQIQFGLMLSERSYAHLLAYNPEIADPRKAFVITKIKAVHKIQDNFRQKLKTYRSHTFSY